MNAARQIQAHRNKGRKCRPASAHNPVAKLLEDNCLSITDVATSLGVSPSAISQVLLGKNTSERTVAYVAQATGKSIAEIQRMIAAAAQERLMASVQSLARHTKASLPA